MFLPRNPSKNGYAKCFLLYTSKIRYFYDIRLHLLRNKSKPDIGKVKKGIEVIHGLQTYCKNNGVDNQVDIKEEGQGHHPANTLG